MAMFEFPTVLAVTDFWMSRWLTPIWFLGVGVAAGLAVLALLLAVFYVLSKVPGLEALRRAGAGIAVAVVATLILSGLYTWFV
ncbi:MAG: hypothetical protein ACK5OB_05895 [Pirellula sp.]